MADILQAIQSAGAPEQGVNVRAALDSVGVSDAPAAPSPPPTIGSRMAMGFGDTINGGARLLTHLLPDSVVNAGNKANNWLADRTGLVAHIPEGGVDQMISQREQAYQQARAQAGQAGIDWWRLGGNALQPGNYVLPGKVATSVLGRVAQATAQGSVLGSIQSSAESTSPNGYWGDVLKGGALGAAGGAVVGSAIEGLSAALRSGVAKVRQAFGSGAASTDAADTIVKNALAEKGVDPSTVNLDLVAGMRSEVQSALDHGADISPTAIANRARAESLPVPINLTRGQATGDAMQFAREQNMRGITGVGEPITTRLTEQNQAAIQNLDILGAKGAPDTVSTGLNYAGRIQQFWDQLQAHKDSLYAAVHNSQGQSAAMDGVGAAQNIKAALDNPQASHAYDLLPPNIKRTIDSLEWNDMPLTVAQWQSLDKVWGQAQRGTNDGSVAHAIGEARRILGQADLADNVGAEAKQAYLAARSAHAQQMSLVDPKLPNGMPNPNFQPLVKSVVMDGKAPEKLFGDGFLNAPPSVASKNLNFLRQLDPEAPRQIGQTLMGEIKRQALSSASDERGTVSQSVLSGWARDPVKSARLDALLPKEAADTFRNLAASVEVAKRFPVASAVNTSNSGAAVVNAGLSMLKDGAFGQITKRLPVVRDISQGLDAAKAQSDVSSALSPGVTLKSMMSATPAQAARNRIASRVIVPTVAAGQASPQSSQGSQD